MKTASYKLDLLKDIELAPPTGQTLPYFVNKLVDPHSGMELNPREARMGIMTYMRIPGPISFLRLQRVKSMDDFYEWHTQKWMGGGDFCEAVSHTSQIALGVAALCDCSSATTLR